MNSHISFQPCLKQKSHTLPLKSPIISNIHVAAGLCQLVEITHSLFFFLQGNRNSISLIHS